MRPLDLYSERYSATGNLASEGMRNQLGKPRMDSLAVMVREAVQNSWDASLSSGPVKVGFEFKTVRGPQLDRWRTLALPGNPPGSMIGEWLAGLAELPLLIISDRGTTGLGGPVRANEEDPEGPARDFVDFLRNVGQPPDKRFGGGTYGYGKAALYRISRIHALLIDTICETSHGLERRLMGSALGDSCLPYTGRHWWGQTAEDGIVDPVRGGEATEIASVLGLPGFEPGDRGTTITLVAPEFGARTQRQAANSVVASLLWNFWPKMLSMGGRTPSMEFSVTVEEEAIPVPDPRSFPPLNGFVAALEDLERDESPAGFATKGDLHCLKPRQILGSMSLRKYAVEPRIPLDTGDESESSAFSGFSHHVALLRVPQLVVRYVSGPELGSDLYEYGGVFLAARDMDRTYAASEPPTHDDWVPAGVDDRRQQTFVRVTFRRLAEAMEEFTSTGEGVVRGAESVPLASLAEKLSSLLPGETGPSARVPAHGGKGKSGGGGGRPSRKASVRVGAATLESRDGVRLLRVPFRLRHADGPASTRLVAEVGVLLDGGDIEGSRSGGHPVPTVAGWEIGSAIDQGQTPEIRVKGKGEEDGVLLVSVPEDTAVAIKLTARGEAD